MGAIAFVGCSGTDLVCCFLVDCSLYRVSVTVRNHRFGERNREPHLWKHLQQSRAME